MVVLRSLCLQVFMSSEADRALGRAQGGNNSQGPIYKMQVTGTHNSEAAYFELGQYRA